MQQHHQQTLVGGAVNPLLPPGTNTTQPKGNTVNTTEKDLLREIARNEYQGILAALKDPEGPRTLAKAIPDMIIEDALADNLPPEAHLGSLAGDVSAVAALATSLLDRIEALEGQVFELTLAAPATDTEV
jgi:hypothetical protein